MSLSSAFKRHLYKALKMFSYQFKLVLSRFGTCLCSNVEVTTSHTSVATFYSATRNTAPAGRRLVETNISWTCLVSGLLSFIPLYTYSTYPFVPFFPLSNLPSNLNWSCLDLIWCAETSFSLTLPTPNIPLLLSLPIPSWSIVIDTDVP